MKVWVTRDSMDRHDQIGVYYCGIFSGKPTKSINGFYYGNGLCLSYKPTGHFKQTFGFTPRKGSCKQYNFTLEEVK